MDEIEAKQRRIGFMSAIGLLLENSESAVKDEILKILNSFGDQLYLEVDNGEHASAASYANVKPCEPPLVWNPVTQQCE